MIVVLGVILALLVFGAILGLLIWRFRGKQTLFFLSEVKRYLIQHEAIRFNMKDHHYMRYIFITNLVSSVTFVI